MSSNCCCHAATCRSATVDVEFLLRQMRLQRLGIRLGQVQIGLRRDVLFGQSAVR